MQDPAGFLRPPELRLTASWWLVGLAGVAAVALVLMLVAAWATADTTNRALRAANREHLAVCIQSAEGLTLDPAEAVAAARAAFAVLETRPTWAWYAPYAVGGPRIDIGCPTEPALFRPRFGRYPPERPTQARGVVADTSVTVPSPYRAYVVVLPDARFGQVLAPELPGRRSTEETVCSGGWCFEVTTGVYISRSELLDAGRLSAALAEALGMADPSHSIDPGPPPRFTPVPPQGSYIDGRTFTPVPRAPKPTMTEEQAKEFGRYAR